MSFLSSINELLKFIANFIIGISLATYYVLKAILLFFVPKCFLFKDVTEEIVLITGGASGLGRLLALNFAKRGATIVIWDLNSTGLEETRKMIEELRSKKDKVGQCFHYQVDISNRFKVYEAAERVKKEVGNVSILINNAGIVQGKRFLECKDEMIVKTFDVNALAHFWLLKAFLPDMMEKNHGHIVSIASIAGLVGAYQLTDYCSSKFAAVGFEESLRLELNCDGYDGIHSTVVCPYYINTGMFDGVGRSLIPVLTPEYVAYETMKAVLVDQEFLAMPMIVYWIHLVKSLLPTKSFLWAHRAIGAAATMKSFKGRNAPNINHNANGSAAATANQQSNGNGNNNMPQSVVIKMKPEKVGITIPIENNQNPNGQQQQQQQQKDNTNHTTTIHLNQ